MPLANSMARHNPWEVSIFPDRGNGRSSIYSAPKRDSSEWSHTSRIRGVSTAGTSRPWEILVFPERFPSSYYSSLTSVTPGGPGDYSTPGEIFRPLSSLDQSGGAGFPLDSPPRSNRSLKRGSSAEPEKLDKVGSEEDDLDCPTFLGNWGSRLRTPVKRKVHSVLETKPIARPYTGIPKVDSAFDAYSPQKMSTEDLFGDDYFARRQGSIEREREEKDENNDDGLLSEARALLEKSQLADQDAPDDKGSPHYGEDEDLVQACDDDAHNKEMEDALAHLESHDHLETLSQFSARMRAAGKQLSRPDDDTNGTWPAAKPSLARQGSRSGSQLSPYKPDGTDDLTQRISRLREWESLTHLTPRQQHLASLGLHDKGN